MARRVALAIPERRDQPDPGFSTKNPHSNRRSSIGPGRCPSPGDHIGRAWQWERWTGSSSAESDTLAPEHSSLNRSQPPPSQAVKACCRVAGEAEALTIALALLQKGLFRLAGTDGTRIGGTQSGWTAMPPAGDVSRPTTPSHRWQLVCSHRGCDMCRFAAATAQKTRCRPMEMRSIGPAGGSPV